MDNLSSSDQDSIEFKIVFLGPASVGKTSLIHRFCNDAFQEETLSTIGAGFFTHVVQVGKTIVTLLLWDTAGEERFKSVTPSLLRGANGLVIVFDISRPKSFDDINDYLEMFLDTVQVENSYELPIILLANKSDLDHTVTSEEIENWCLKNGVTHHYNVSAKTGENVNNAISDLVNILMKPPAENDRIAIRIASTPADTSSSCC